MATEVYSDIDNAFERDLRTFDLRKSVDIDAIRNSLRNILQTRKMERRMLPEFGASLEQLLFEPIDDTTAKRIGSIMIDEITYWDPRITVNNVDVIANEDKMRYDITLSYNIQSSSISRDVINFVLQQ